MKDSDTAQLPTQGRPTAQLLIASSCDSFFLLRVPLGDDRHKGPRTWPFPPSVGPFKTAHFAPEFSVGWQIFHQPLLPSIASSPFLSSPAPHVHVYLHLRDNLLEASSHHDSLVITCYMHSPQGQTGEGDTVLHARSLRTSVNENVHPYY